MDSISSEMRKTAYKVDRAFGDSFMDQVKQIMGGVILRRASNDEDCNRSYDLTLTKESAYRTGVRIRRNGFFEKYPGEFTIRKEKASGRKTEFEKISEGNGDYYFYGQVNEDGSALDRWMVLDLDVFRRGLIEMCDEEKRSAFRLVHPTNQDSFYAFNLEDFPNEMVLEEEGVAV